MKKSAGGSRPQHFSPIQSLVAGLFLFCTVCKKYVYYMSIALYIGR